MLLQIGEFARLTGLSVRTVRYYGDVGVLPPSEVDDSTGYRRYRVDQVERAMQLVALKEVGLTLDEIKLVLDDVLNDIEFRDLLRTKVTELEAAELSAKERLHRARQHLRALENRLENPMPDVLIKTTEPKTIAYVREQISGVEGIAPMFPKLFRSVDRGAAIGPAGNVYHEFSEDGSRIDVEAMIHVPDDYAPTGPVKTRVIDATQVATLTHHGAFNRLWEAHATLLGWVESNGYEVSGPSYEWSIICTEPVTQDDESYVTEIQVEVVQA